MKTRHRSPLHVSVAKINYIFNSVHDTVLNTDDDNDDDDEEDDDEQRWTQTYKIISNDGQEERVQETREQRH